MIDVNIFMMIRMIMIALSIIFSSGFTINAFASSGPGGVFDTKSDSNSNVSFIPGDANMKFSKDNITAGSEKALNNTIGNGTEFMNPAFDPSKPIKEYDSNSSNWNKIVPQPEGRSE